VERYFKRWQFLALGSVRVLTVAAMFLYIYLISRHAIWWLYFPMMCIIQVDALACIVGVHGRRLEAAERYTEKGTAQNRNALMSATSPLRIPRLLRDNVFMHLSVWLLFVLSLVLR